MSDEIAAISRLFEIPGELVSAAPYGEGHINDTFLAVYEQESRKRRYLHQRINDRVFADPWAVTSNIERVTGHMVRKLTEAGRPDVSRRALSLIPTRAGLSCLRTEGGEYWRTYPFVEGTRTCQTIERPEQAYQAARAFGEFQALLADLPVPRLVETISNFHHTPKRWTAFEQALSAAAPDRAAQAKEEIATARELRPLANTLIDLHERGAVPERITHNDTKLNNVLFDTETGEAICVVDLDTVMPGLSLYDFGDMVRTMTTTAAEDETDPSRVEIQVQLYEAVTRGYLESAGRMLNGPERDHLVAAGQTIIFEQALRFLTDYLAGDPYYKTSRPHHNLDRARCQFALLQSINRCEDELATVVRLAIE